MCSLILLAMVVNLLNMYSKFKNGLSAENSLKITGMITITMMVIYAIIMDVTYNIYLSDLFSMYEESLGISYSYTNFWTTLGIGGGFILPFISGGLSIVGSYVIRNYSRRDYIVSREPTYTYKNTPDMVIPAENPKKEIIDNLTVEKSRKIKFCSMCGSKNPEIGKFCK